MAEFILRNAELGDVDEITAVHIKSWQETYRGIMPDEYLDNLKSLEGKKRRDLWDQTLGKAELRENICVAEIDGMVVGFCWVGKSHDKEPIADGEIYAIYLLKKHHRTRIGRTMFSRGMTRLSKLGFKSASLWVAKGNPTQGFYEHMGGVLRGEKTDTCWGITVQECRYFWPDLEVRKVETRERR